MTEIAEETPTTTTSDEVEEAPKPTGLRKYTEIPAVASYLVLAYYVTLRLWLDVPNTIADGHKGDRAFAEWNLAAAARALAHLDNPLFSRQMNVPLGVNAMANTSMLGLGLPLAPVTWLFGAPATFDLTILIGLAGTGIAWYFVLSRHVVKSRLAAWVGGCVGGFAPSVTSHAELHPNLVAQFMIPLIALFGLRLREPGHPVRRGLILAALVVYQAFLNEELLFITGLGLFVFIIVYCLSRPRTIRPMVRPFALGAAVTAVVAGVLLAYPLWFQFTGPASYHGVDPTIAALRADVLSLFSFANNSLAIHFSAANPIPETAPEDNANFGWVLLLAAIIIVVFRWHHLVVRAAGITALTFAVLSLGPELTVRDQPTGIPGPWALLDKLPLFDSALPVRIAMGMTPCVAVIIAVGFDRLLRRLPVALVGALAAALLLPNAPVPVPAAKLSTPSFIADGTWRQYVGPGQSMLVVPTPSFFEPSAIYWSARLDDDLPISHGYFLGPDANGRGHLGPVPRPGDLILNVAYTTGQVPTITDADRAQFRDDLRFWHTAVILFRPGQNATPSLRLTVEQLVGKPPQQIGTVDIWDTRDVIVPGK
jgi:hypothetical protein